MSRLRPHYNPQKDMDRWENPSDEELRVQVQGFKKLMQERSLKEESAGPSSEERRFNEYSDVLQRAVDANSGLTLEKAWEMAKELGW